MDRCGGYGEGGRSIGEFGRNKLTLNIN
jgi:hypothetical protein